MVLGVDDFKAKIDGGGARPTLFQVTINYPVFANGDTEETSFMVKASSLPGSMMAPIIVPFRGREVKVAGDRTFDTWNITVINDTDFDIRDSFERWMNAINAHSTNTGLTNPVDYQADLKVEQLDRDETVLKTYFMRGAFPQMVSPIEVSWEAVNQIEEFQVEFSYQYWEADTTS